MFREIWTVARKEIDETLFKTGKEGGGIKQYIFLILMMAVGITFMGESYVKSWIAVYFACFPLSMISSLTADLFAGERERHTLATLLATRLSDTAILAGKLLAVTLIGWTMALVIQLLAIILINLFVAKNGFVFFPPEIALSMIVIALLMSFLTMNIGLLFSMHAATIRQAQQRAAFPLLGILYIPALVPIGFYFMFPPDQYPAVYDILGKIGVGGLIAIESIVLALVNIVLMRLGIARFQRSQLILD